MVEAPKIKIYHIKIKKYINKRIKQIKSNKKDYEILIGQIINNIYFIGKHLWFEFNDFYIRIHFVMYGRININKLYKKRKPQLTLYIDKDKIYFYKSSIKIINKKELKKHVISKQEYDISNDLYSEELHKKFIEKNLIKFRNAYITDFILDQRLFPGVGNILKNEALYQCKIYPELKVKKINIEKIFCIINTLKKVCDKMYIYEKNINENNFSKIFNNVKKKVFKIYHKSICSYCGAKIKLKYLGKTHRRTYYCDCYKKS
jgi:endonuclease-8